MFAIDLCGLHLNELTFPGKGLIHVLTFLAFPRAPNTVRGRGLAFSQLPPKNHKATHTLPCAHNY